MADGISVNITGPDIAALALAATERIQQKTRVYLDKVANATLADAKDNCPVDTGTLRDSLDVSASPYKRQIGTDVSYAIYVHNGTYKMKARPFLTNALEKNKQTWVSSILADPGV